jgi:hypothetical protein
MSIWGYCWLSWEGIGLPIKRSRVCAPPSWCMVFYFFTWANLFYMWTMIIAKFWTYHNNSTHCYIIGLTYDRGRIQHSDTEWLFQYALPPPKATVAVSVFLIFYNYFKRFNHFISNIWVVFHQHLCYRWHWTLPRVISCVLTRIRAFQFQIRFWNDGLTCGCKLLIENPSFLNYVVCHFCPRWWLCLNHTSLWSQRIKFDKFA